jgi:hypothetical protein
MEKFTVSLDATINAQKPTDDVRRISARLKRTEVTLEELATKLTQPYGYTFSAGVFATDGIRNNKSWQSQQLFALDFDRDITLKDVLERATRFDIKPVFAYSSFSASEVYPNKFRVIWAMNEVVKTEQVRNLIILSLMQIFPECDNSCKDASRIYFGGKELLYSDYGNRLLIDDLVDAVVQTIYIGDRSNASKYIKAWSQRVGLSLINGLPVLTQLEEVVKSDELSTKSLYNKDLAVNSSKKGTSLDQIEFAKTKEVNDFKIKYGAVTNTEVKLDLLRRVDFGQLSDDCEVLRDFLNGVDHHHTVTWMVMSNLLLLEGGEKLFWAGLHNRDEIDPIKWQGQIYARRLQRRIPPGYRTLEPWYPGITENTPYANLYQRAEAQLGSVYQIEEQKYIPLKEAEALNTAYYNEAIEGVKRNTKKVYCILAQTAIGKTYTILSKQYDSLMLAVPRHDLKDELAQRASEAGHTNVQTTPKAPEGHWTLEVKRLYAVGAVNKASAYLRNLAKTEPVLAAYFEHLDSIEDGGLLLTTHAKAMHMKTSAPGIVWDEDITQTLIKQTECNISDLKVMVMTLTKPRMGFGAMQNQEDYSSLQRLVQFIDDAEYEVAHAMPLDLVEPARNELAKLIETTVINDKSITSNVIGFIWGDFFTKSQKLNKIYSVRKRELDPEKTHIIMSATLNKRMCELLFGDRLEWREVPMAEPMSPVYLHPENSFSKADIARNPELFKNWVVYYTELGFIIITHKEWSNLSPAVKAWFYATAGIDALKALPSAILGTPYSAPSNYLLTAAALGVPVTTTPDSHKMHYREIRRSGFCYKLMLMTAHPDLTEIQLAVIEAEIIQAIGRSRGLRFENSPVHVHGAIPVPGVILLN